MKRLFMADRGRGVLKQLLPFLVGTAGYLIYAIINAVMLGVEEFQFGAPFGLLAGATAWVAYVLISSLWEAGRWNLALTMGITRRQIGVYSFLRQLTMNCLFYLVLLVLWHLETLIMGNMWKPGLGVETWIYDLRWIPALILGVAALKAFLTLIYHRWGGTGFMVAWFALLYSPLLFTEGRSVPALIWVPAVILLLASIPVMLFKMEAR